MSQLFASKIKRDADASITTKVLNEVTRFVNEQRSEMRSISNIIGLESLNESQSNELESTVNNWVSGLERITQDLSLEHSQPSQIEGAAAIMGSLADIHSFINTKIVTEGNSGPNTTFVGSEGMADGMATRLPAFEAYDEKDNRNAVAYSVAYNMIAGRQNDFGEAFFPTVTVTNDNVGVQVSIRLVQVYNDFKRETDGALANYQKKNIVKAMIDNTILKNDMTRIFPVFRTGVNEDNFVDTAVIPSYTVDNEGETIETAPLKVGQKFDLLALSQTDTLIANGLMDATDSIDPAIELDNIYVTLQNDKYRLKVRGLAGANFVYSPQDLHRLQTLRFVTSGIMVNKELKQIDGSNPADLADIVSNDLIVYLAVDMYGEVNVELGTTFVHAPSITVARVVNAATGLDVPLDTAPALDVVNKFADAKIVGYDLWAYRTNLNRRQRGQLLDVTYYNQIWAVPLRSPITMLKPVNADSSSDNSDLAALVSATFVRTSNEAVRTLTQTADMLKGFVDARAARPVTEYDNMPALFGVARFLIDPTFIGEDLDVNAEINSIASHERSKDVCSVLVQKIRDIAYRLYRDSGFQAVVETQAAGIEGNPTIIVGTDPMTARYLMIDGENRMAGPDFEYKVVTTPDITVMNKIYIALGYPGSNQNQLNPLHFGNMLWSPELVLTLPIARGGQISKELTVQPRFRHIVNVPVLGVINVSNLPEAATKNIVLQNHPNP